MDSLGFSLNQTGGVRMCRGSLAICLWKGAPARQPLKIERLKLSTIVGGFVDLMEAYDVPPRPAEYSSV